MSRRRRVPPALFVLIEGMGVAPAGPSNGVSQAQFPYLGSLGLVYPRAVLGAAGPELGLAPGEPAGLEGGLRAVLEGRRVPGESLGVPALVASFAQAGLRQRLVLDASEPDPPRLMSLFGAGLARGLDTAPVRTSRPGGLSPALLLAAETVRSLREPEADVYYVLLRDVEAASLAAPSVARACEAVDDAVSRMVPEFLARGGLVLALGTHGRGEALDEAAEHGCTANPVWLFCAHPDARDAGLASPTLFDVAPTALAFMDVEAAVPMTGRPVVTRAARR